MPRPLRIEYEDALYHVMNRGRGRQVTFHDDIYYQIFLETVKEAHHRFGIEIQCYCLMNNHYHLLVKTPEGNLGRAMRHINGQYTQRYNRLQKTDGALFRGRYKAILVEKDSYQLRLSRYIHRNPMEAGLVEDLDAYQWSSYPAYVGKMTVPAWLKPNEIYAQLGAKNDQQEKFRAYTEKGIDEELNKFFNKDHQVPYLGSDKFKDWAYKQKQTDEKALSKQSIRCFRPKIDHVAETVSRHYDINLDLIKESQRGRVVDNIPRWIVMYLAQDVCGLKLHEIANYMSLKRSGSISTTIAKLKARMKTDTVLADKVNKIKSEYYT